LSDDEPLMPSLCLSWRSVIVESPHFMSLVSAPSTDGPLPPTWHDTLCSNGAIRL
jgi:hypothetical protein